MSEKEQPDLPAAPAADVTFIPDRDSPESIADVFNQPDVQDAIPLTRQPTTFDRLYDDRTGERKADAAELPRAPAMHGDALWGGPQWITNATAEPVWVETKEAYFELLARHGLHMRDQAESRMPDVPRAPEPTPVHLTPHPPVPPLTERDAETFGAIEAIFRKYGIVESLWCTHCFARDVQHGMRCVVTEHRVMVECRGGQALFSTPIGESNLILRAMANTARTRADFVAGTVSLPNAGPHFLPAQVLSPIEGAIIRSYMAVLLRRGIEPRWHHRGCWSGSSLSEDDAMAVQIGERSIVALCRCFQLFERREKMHGADTIQ